ncbi:Nucleotidyl transferase AbiEii toxin, Type IV TA system [Chitinophaga rupis]|uniref:Nucleotidyl transferase AbiEii toxin, Type IV TA system n=2 Tax=Chitinophaga rupis TaxID=573321 RepID=A0A1H8C7V5_9BACT|nr:Nucleotidyl transferase AbiEii toxin, Type IV TA system [Chitinophaga rupis]
MNALPSKQAIEDVAAELEIAPAFVEKDWFVTQVIKLIAEFSHEDFVMVFSGGTSLSKAHHILKRFSEDIDFRVICPSLEGLSQSKKRARLSALKKAMFSHLKEAFPELEDKELIARNGNQFFAINLNYPTLFDRDQALRPHVLVEFTIATLMLSGITLSVSSFLAQSAGAPPEVKSIPCIDPVENASDKASAFVWRTVERERGAEGDDPSIVRHLHDLSLLSPIGIAHPKFKEMVLMTLQQDDSRSKKLVGLTPKEKFSRAITTIKEDPEYEKEYIRFVEGMSYAKTSDMPPFHLAITNLEALIKHVLDT